MPGRRRPQEVAEAALPLPLPAAKPARTGAEGHRQRLRQRLLDSDGAGMPDYEILELILFGAITRGDTKPLAKRLIKQFKDLSGVLNATEKDLAAIDGCGTGAIGAIRTARVAGHRLLRQEMLQADILATEQAVLDYCGATMGMEEIEHFRLIFLNVQNRVIGEEVQQRGTVNHTPVYTREVVKSALDCHASAVIMVHNHPSGSTTPSQADIQMTRQVRDALKAVDIVLHDHLIIARGDHLSFRAQRLL